MRILHIDTGQEVRGGQRQALLLIEALRKNGHECGLLARPGSPVHSLAKASGVSVYPASLLSLWLRSRAYDLVHAHDAHGHSTAVIASRVPIVVSRRVAFPVGGSPASRWKYRRAARFVAVSRFVARQLEEAGVEKEKIDIVYDAIDTGAEFSGWNPLGPVVALGSHDPEKGRDLVERAAALAGIPVLFSDNLAEDLRNASLFLYISRSEGFGSAALLAMSMGVPVIASKVGGLMEVFEDNISGIAVENEPQAIAEAMTRIRVNVDLAKTLVTNARDRVERKFNVNQMVCGTTATYRRALGR